jgi:hypothetical protein
MSKSNGQKLEAFAGSENGREGEIGRFKSLDAALRSSISHMPWTAIPFTPNSERPPPDLPFPLSTLSHLAAPSAPRTSLPAADLP